MFNFAELCIPIFPFCTAGEKYDTLMLRKARILVRGFGKDRKEAGA